MQEDAKKIVVLMAYFDVEKETFIEALWRQTKGLKLIDRMILIGGTKHLLKHYKRPVSANFYKIEQTIPRGPFATVRTKMTPVT